jgi:hypothetical protein
VSIEAIAWALNTAPIPTHRRDASTLAAVLIGLANHADPDGHNAFPSVSRLVRYTRLSERTVRSALHTLEQLGLITPSDPDILAAHIRRADRRPNGWDLALTTGPTPPPHPAEPRPIRLSTALSTAATAGCNHCTPLTSTGCKHSPTGCKQRPHGVQPLHPNRPRTITSTIPRAPPREHLPVTSAGPCPPSPRRSRRPAASATPDTVTPPAPASNGSTSTANDPAPAPAATPPP